MGWGCQRRVVRVSIRTTPGCQRTQRDHLGRYVRGFPLKFSEFWTCLDLMRLSGGGGGGNRTLVRERFARSFYRFSPGLILVALRAPEQASERHVCLVPRAYGRLHLRAVPMGFVDP